MKKSSIFLLVFCCVIWLVSCNNTSVKKTENDNDEVSSLILEEQQSSETEDEKEGEVTMNIQVATKSFTASLYDNSSTKELSGKFPLTLEMSDMNGNEKYCFMNESIIANPKSVKKINSGDIMLYGTNCLVIFYKTFDTSYSYTPLGHISDIEGFMEAIKEVGGHITLDIEP